ncbi:hypothetical protein CONPUDRAFT_154710 [Coniophora puteana RWD-64-598 SS2]|uniref:Uncharacterized protein n=1 Tax=Coniophora puteana (strain RWD-64-598) TaxID=741705 RepID=A0A5M3MNF2_CONPW|nr:uncharacterized protein CONPUDRAFT_154710 [Coniophora puteana RWD-64-598 SS2]EIW80698.1 hypothetical protein CONPUDRAFT_154710 [Coniophora puteana RWD-64-598 SS2]
MNSVTDDTAPYQSAADVDFELPLASQSPVVFNIDLADGPSLWADAHQKLLGLGDRLIDIRIDVSRAPDGFDWIRHLSEASHNVLENVFSPSIAPQVRKYDIIATPKALPFFLNELRRPAPALESLRLECSQHVESKCSPHVKSEYSQDAQMKCSQYDEFLPLTLLDGHAPYLREIILDNIALPWNSPLWGYHLREIQLISVPEKLAPTTTQILTIFSGTTLLQTFEMRHTLPVPDLPSVPEHEGHLCALPHLTGISLHGPYERYTHLMAYLLPPVDALVEATIDGFEHEGHGHPANLPLIPAETLAPPVDVECLDLEFWDDCHAVVLSSSSDATNAPDWPWNPASPFDMRFDASFKLSCLNGGHEHIVSTYTSLSESLRARTISTLRIDAVRPRYTVPWMTILTSLPHVQRLSLKVDDSALYQLLHILQPWRPSAPGGPHGSRAYLPPTHGRYSLVLPQLKELVLSWGHSYPGDEDVANHNNFILAQELASCLHARASVNAKLAYLEVRSHQLTLRSGRLWPEVGVPYLIGAASSWRWVETIEEFEDSHSDNDGCWEFR